MKRLVFLSITPVFLLLLSCAIAPAFVLAKERPQEGEAQGLPLKPTRTARFMTEEGTWMSVDVSPDGKHVVFDLLGDLYILPIGGGTATRLTSGMAFDSRPLFSPDGSHIAFISDRNGFSNLWTMRTDGSDISAVTNVVSNRFCSMTWSADGRALFSISGSSDVGGSSMDPATIAMHPLDGGPVRLLKEYSIKSLFWCGGSGPEVSRDQLYLYYAKGGPSVGDYQIWRLDLSTGSEKMITAAPGGAVGPLLSRSGRLLIYATRSISGETGFRLRDLAAGSERWVAQDVQRDAQGGKGSDGMLPNSAFTPSDEALVTSHDGKIWWIELETGEATEIPFLADVEQRLGALTEFEYAIDDESVAASRLRFARMSPDGEHILFNAFGCIWISELGTDQSRRLTVPKDHAIEPAWSPDGRHVAYTTWDERSGGAIFRMPIDGRSKPERITTEAAFFRDLTYAPEGDRLYFKVANVKSGFTESDPLGNTSIGPLVDRTDEDMYFALASMLVSGGTMDIIAPLHKRGASYEGGRPHFVRTDGRVYYKDWITEEGTLSPTLVSVNLEGTKRRVELAGSPFLLRDAVISPQGDRVLVLTYTRQLYLVSLPEGRPGTDLKSVIGSTSDLSSERAGSDFAHLVSATGADFIGWSRNGDSFYYALGPKLHRYDLKEFEAQGSSYHPLVDVIVATVPAARPHGDVVFRGARIITMNGNEILNNADLVVSRNRIAAVGPSGKTTVPKGAAEIDARGATIIPGWVDVHSHLGYTYLLRREHPGLLAHLAYGVTATRDPAVAAEDTLSYYAEEIDAGIRMGPRLYGVGNEHRSFSPSGVASVDDVTDALRRYTAEYWNTETLKQYGHGDRLIRQWIVMAASRLRLTPTNESNGLATNLSMAIDGYGGLEHPIGVTPIYNDVAQLLAQSGIVWTPTLSSQSEMYNLYQRNLASDEKLHRFYPVPWSWVRGPLELRRDDRERVLSIAMDLKKVVDAGGRVGLGSHGVPGISVHLELWDIASGGIEVNDVLRIGTIWSAEAIGHGADFGSIEVGKLADFQVLDKDPLADIRNTLSVRLVIKNGFVYDADTLDQVWPKQVPLDQQWWQAQ